jgi:hypothetical protein
MEGGCVSVFGLRILFYLTNDYYALLLAVDMHDNLLIYL